MSLSGDGRVNVTLEEDPLGARTIQEMSGTYKHPNLTMIWEVEDPGAQDPAQAKRIWSLDVTVSAQADSIEGRVEVHQIGGGLITLTRK